MTRNKAEFWKNWTVGNMNIRTALSLWKITLRALKNEVVNKAPPFWVIRLVILAKLLKHCFEKTHAPQCS